MDTARRPDHARPLEDLRRRLIQWRSARTQRGPIPEVLWREAARLARVHGVGRIAKVLGLGFEGLKRRTEGGKPPARAARGPSFVEIDPSSMPLVPGLSVEVERPDGTKMTIRHCGADPVDLASLVESFAGKRG
jgi:hypothetical protein